MKLPGRDAQRCGVSWGLAVSNALPPRLSQLPKQTDQHPVFPSALEQEQLRYVAGVTSVKGKAIDQH